jgi:hypothetical protein
MIRRRTWPVAALLIFEVWIGCGSDETTEPAAVSSSTSVAASTGSGMCPQEPMPPGAASCPQACTGGCTSQNVCLIDCSMPGCSGTTLECPPDYACQVLCTAADACDATIVSCPPTYGCSLVCNGGTDACGDVAFNCADGPCDVQCAADACTGMTVTCGSGACAAACTGMPPPTLACGSACSCVTC